MVVLRFKILVLLFNRYSVSLVSKDEIPSDQYALEFAGNIFVQLLHLIKVCFP